MACPEEELQVHHIVDDNRIMPGFAVPGLYTAHSRIEAGRERAGAVHQNILKTGISHLQAWIGQFIGRISENAQSISIAAIHHKTQVVGAFV